MQPAQAARAARAALGNVPLIAEDARAVWGWAWLDALVLDVRAALRLMGRAPAFTALCVLVLAFGSGASTTLYAVVHEVLIRPLPYPEPARVVRVSEERPGAAAPTRDALLSNLTFHAACCAAIDHSSGVVTLDETETLHPSKVVVEGPEGQPAIGGDCRYQEIADPEPVALGAGSRDPAVDAAPKSRRSGTGPASRIARAAVAALARAIHRSAAPRAQEPAAPPREAAEL